MEAMKVPSKKTDQTKTSTTMPALAFTEPLSRVVLREAVEIFFDPKHAEPKHWEKLKEGLMKKFTAPGDGRPVDLRSNVITIGLSDYSKLVHPTKTLRGLFRGHRDPQGPAETHRDSQGHHKISIRFS